MRRVSKRHRKINQILRFYLYPALYKANRKAHNGILTCVKCKRTFPESDFCLDHVDGRRLRKLQLMVDVIREKPKGCLILPIVAPTNLQVMCKWCNCGPEGVFHHDYRTSEEVAFASKLEQRIFDNLMVKTGDRLNDILEAFKAVFKNE